jgi:AcrR family transcriptional regulator
MASTRRLGSENSATRAAILKAALEVLQDQGGGHFTASAIARRAGLKPHMVHYYFRTIDDVVLALVKTLGATGLKNSARAIASDNPLKALWDIEMGSKSSVAIMELGALAVHREDIRAEMGRYIEQLRTIQAEAVARYLELRGIDPPIPPMSLTLVIAAIARQMVREKDFGVSLGHAELTAAVEAMLAGTPAKA